MAILIRPVLTVTTGATSYIARGHLWQRPSAIEKATSFLWICLQDDGPSLPAKLGQDKSKWTFSLSLEVSDGRLVEWWNDSERVSGPLYRRGLNGPVIRFADGFDVTTCNNRIRGLEFWLADHKALDARLKIVTEALANVEAARDRKRKAQENLDDYWPTQRRRLENEIQQLAAKEADTRRWLLEGEADEEEARALAQLELVCETQ